MTALSMRVDALTEVDEKSTPSALIISLENRAKLEARLCTLEAQGDATGVRHFATGPNQQKRVKLETYQYPSRHITNPSILIIVVIAPIERCDPDREKEENFWVVSGAEEWCIRACRA
jgi:hypothetical protein